MTYGEELRHIRDTLDLSQEDFAVLLGTRGITISRYELGHSKVPEPTMRLARVLRAQTREPLPPYRVETRGRPRQANKRPQQ